MDQDPHGSTPREPDEAVSVPDPLVERLRGADPATVAQADVEALRALVDARIADVDGEYGGASAAGGATVASLDAVRASRDDSPRTPGAGRRGLAQAAAAAAALVVVGTGGYALGAGGGSADSGGEATSQGQSAPAGEGWAEIAPGLPGADMPQLGPASPLPGGGGLAAEDSAADGLVVDSAPSLLWPTGRVVVEGSGFATTAGTATAWIARPVAGAAETMTALAEVTGVEGGLVDSDGWLSIGDRDGGGALWSSWDGGTWLQFYDPAADPWADCEIVPADASVSSDAEAGLAPYPGECDWAGFPPALGEAEAFDRLLEILAAAGVDPAAVELTSESAAGDQGFRHVNAWILLDGARSDLSWSATFTGHGLLSVSGELIGAESLGEYPIVSEAQALERMSDPRFGLSGGWAAPFAGVEGASPPATAIAPGDRIPWLVTRVTVTGVELTLASQYLDGGEVALVPTYTFTDDGGGEWTVIAIADAALDFG